MPAHQLGAQLFLGIVEVDDKQAAAVVERTDGSELLAELPSRCTVLSGTPIVLVAVLLNGDAAGQLASALLADPGLLVGVPDRPAHGCWAAKRVGEPVDAIGEGEVAQHGSVDDGWFSRQGPR